MLTILRALTAVIFIVVSLTAHAQSDRLFSPPQGGAANVQRPAHAMASKFRAVGVNRGILGKKRFKLELFDGDHVAVRERLDKYKGGSFVWVGHLESEPESQVIFAFKKNSVSGFITRNGATIELGANRDGQMALYQVDKSALPPIEPDTLPVGDSGGTAGLETFTGYVEGSVTQDLLVVYTQASCDQRGGCNNLEADILAAVGDINQGYINSQVGIYLNLTDTRLVSYDESGSITQSLLELTWHAGHPNDPTGAMDEVHTWRDETLADVVAMVTDDGNYCGIGWVNSDVNTAFSVTHWSCLSGRSLSHEIGHNQGNAHNAENASVSGTFAYSYGYRVCETGGFRTVMSYDSGCAIPRVNHFSNPAINYQGETTGIDNAADNALSMNNTAMLVSGFNQPASELLSINNPGSQNSEVDESISLNIIANSAADYTLTFAASGLPGGLSIDQDSGLINGQVSSTGSHMVNVSVSDGQAMVAAKFNWQVGDDTGGGSGGTSGAQADGCTPQNKMQFIYYADYVIAYLNPACSLTPVLPEVVDPGLQANLANAYAQLQIEASDDNGDVLSFTATGLPTGLSISVSTGLISGQIAASETGEHAVTVSVSDEAESVDVVFNWQVFGLPAVTELKHIWTDESSRLFKLAWRYPQSALADPYQTPAYFKVSPGATQPEASTAPQDVAIGANVGNRMWQSYGLDGFYYLGSTFWVAACVGEDQCGPLVAVNLQTSPGSHDLLAVSQLNLTWLDESAGTFELDWAYDNDYLTSSTGKPDYFEITPTIDPNATPITLTAGSPNPPAWQSDMIDDDNYIGSSYTVKACKGNGECGPSQVMSFSRQFADPGFPVPQWSHSDIVVNESLRFSLNWPAVDDIDYYTIEEVGPLGTSIFFSEDNSLGLERATEGTYIFRIRACDRDREAGDRCGVYSSTIYANVSLDQQMESVTNSGWFWVNQSNNEIRLNWNYPSAAYADSNSRPDYFEVVFTGSGMMGFDFDHTVDASNGDGDYTWASDLIGLSAVATQGNFTVKACTNGGACGERVFINPWNDPPSPALDQDYDAQSNYWDNPLPATPDVGGPDDMKPGHWWDSDRAGTGWDFYWASELRYPGVHESYGDTYDLMAFWYTYKQINGAWSPVWFYAEMKLETRLILGEVINSYRGTLYYPTKTIDNEACDLDNRCAVGTLEVFFDSNSNTQATVSVTVNSDSGFENLTPAFELSYIAEDPDLFDTATPENPHDHFSGMWVPEGTGKLLDGDFAISTWIDSWFESVIVVHYDTDGEPIWTRADFDGRNGTNTMEDAVEQVNENYRAFGSGSVYTVGEGFDPTSDPIVLPTGFPDNVGAGFGGRVYEDGSAYKDYRKAGVWLDLYPTSGSVSGSRTFDLQADETGSIVGLVKWASFHDIRFYVGEGRTEATECRLIDGSCGLYLNWFTDAEYPQITAFLHNIDTGVYTKIATAGHTNASYPATIDYAYSISQVGTYQLELWKFGDVESAIDDTPDLDVQGNAQIAVSKILTVLEDNGTTNANPEQPPEEPALMPVQTEAELEITSRVGAIAGQFRVDESGSATYSIPILTAPGSGGVAPQISLNYSSQAGNGPLGVGWSLGGVSAITRCGRTIEQDGTDLPRGVTLTADDRFCLDGQRLMLVNGATHSYGADGAEYRTEIDSISRIKSIGQVAVGGTGPLYFTVERKDGSTSHYGHTGDSRIEANTKSDAGIEDTDTVLFWAQNRFKDSAGNYIDYGYDERSNGAGMPVEFVLKKILYTANDETNTDHYARLKFVYEEPRPDISISSVAGAQIKQSLRLTQIKSRASTKAGEPLTNLRFYYFQYDTDGHGRSILTSVNECSNEDGTYCLTPTLFEWQLSKHQIGSSSESIFGSKLAVNKFLGLAMADINGDGRLDMLISEKPENNLQFRIALASSDGKFTELGETYSIPDNGNHGVPVTLHAIDLNADGFQDVIYPSKNTAGVFSWKARVSNSSTLGSEQDVVIGCCGQTDPDLVRIMDFDGDGLSDLVTSQESSSAADKLVFLRNTYSPADPATVGFETTPSDIRITNIPGGLFKANFGEWKRDEQGSYFNGLLTSKGLFDQPFDYNGDGAVDTLIKLSQLYTKCGSGCNENLNGPISSLGEFVINSDSIDGVAAETNPDRTYVSVYAILVSDGDSKFWIQDIVATGTDCGIWAVCDDPNSTIAYGSLPKAKRVYSVDINADGLADFAYQYENPSIGKYGFKARINVGGRFSSTDISIAPEMDLDVGEYAIFRDVTGDGFLEFLYPSDLDNGDAVWVIAENQNGKDFDAPAHSTIKFGHSGHFDASILVDVNGDGMVDNLLIDRDKDTGAVNSTTSVYLGGNSISDQPSDAATNVIVGISNGFEALTTVTYKPLTDTSVYTRMRDSGGATWSANGSVVYDLIAPIFVVSEVQSSAPIKDDFKALSSVEYHYVGAKMQGGGRGFLGFGEVITYDPQSSIRTNTRYRQDYPFIGLPADTTQAIADDLRKFATMSDSSAITPADWPTVSATTAAPDLSATSDTLLSYAINEWAVISTVNIPAARDPVFPHIFRSLERSYTLAGEFSRKVLTSNVDDVNSGYDIFGNLFKSTVETFGTDNGPWLASQSTVNTYEEYDSDGDDANWQADWLLGRLATSKVTHSRRDMSNFEISSIERNSAFEYNTSTGILNKETIEPGHATLEVKTTYTHDGIGNRTSIAVKGAGMTATVETNTGLVNRASFEVYDDLGRFVVESKNALDQVTQKITSWDAYGNPLSVENIDGIVTTNVVDHMGRPVLTYTETGVWSKVVNAFGASQYCPTEETSFHSTTTGGGAPTQIQCFDQLGRTIRTAVERLSGSYAYTDQYYDSSGRVERVSEPYYDGNTLYWNITSYDAIGRLTGVQSAAGDDVVNDYDESAINACGVSPAARVQVITNSLDQKRVEIKNALGETTHVYDDKFNDDTCGLVTYTYDATNNLTKVTGADGEFVTMEYDLAGRKVKLDDPDKGIWEYAYNALGEMTRQHDSNNQAIDFEYDLLGRVTDRRELTSVFNLTDPAPLAENHEISTYRNDSPGKSQPATVIYLEGESGTLLHGKTFTYDGYGRVDLVSTTIYTGIGTEVFAEQTTYDQFSRVFQQFDASGDDHGLRHVYTNGYVSQLKEAREGIEGLVYQSIQIMDARGNVTEMTLGNGVVANADYEEKSGRLKKLTAYDAGEVEIQEVDYIFDVLGNLKARHDLSASTNLNETFGYDELNRLKTVDLSVNAAASVTTMSLSYDASGNIMYKSDVGTYLYEGAQPHAVSRMVNGAQIVDYSYDANGNQVSGDGRTISYTVFDKPDSISKGNSQVDFEYGVGNSRYQREDYDTSIPTEPLQKLTLYLGSTERITENGSTFFKRYLGGVAIATYYPTTEIQDIDYLLKDHIGSIHTVLNEDGVITARMHFGAFGQRQDVLDWQTPMSGVQYALEAITTRGFTGHEQLDSVGVIHTNGRLYDPKLGRFLQADPIVQAPKNSQNLNRYSYVLNNPLSYTDPTGYSFKSFFKKYWRVIVAAVATYVTWGAASAWAAGFAWGSTAGTAATLTAAGGAVAGAITGAVGGAILTGTVKGAFYGALSGAALGAIGASGLSKFGKTVASGAANGITTELQGGKFGHGFLSAGVGSVAGVYTGGKPDFGKFLVAATAGGTVSELTGGKFANGAISAGLAYAVTAGARSAPKQDGTSNSSNTDSLRVIGDIFGKIWALPNTIIGTVYGLAGHVVGEIGYALGFYDVSPSISIGNNAIQFLNNPLAIPGTAITLGNTISYGRGVHPSQYGAYGDTSVQIGLHEKAHTYQYQALGPLFLPAYFISGGISGTASNPFENAAQIYGRGEGSWWP